MNGGPECVIITLLLVTDLGFFELCFRLHCPKASQRNNQGNSNNVQDHALSIGFVKSTQKCCMPFKEFRVRRPPCLSTPLMHQKLRDVSLVASTKPCLITPRPSHNLLMQFLPLQPERAQIFFPLLFVFHSEVCRAVSRLHTQTEALKETIMAFECVCVYFSPIFVIMNPGNVVVGFTQ